MTAIPPRPDPHEPPTEADCQRRFGVSLARYRRYRCIERDNPGTRLLHDLTAPLPPNPAADRAAAGRERDRLRVEAARERLD